MSTDSILSQIIYPELKTTYRLGNSGTNFHIWRSKLDLALVEHQVKYVLTEPKPPKDKPSDAARHDKWVADDLKARHIILGTLTDNLYMTHVKRDTAKSLMDALSKFFAMSFGQRQDLYMRYTRHKMKEGARINQHIIEMEAMARELELEGLKITQREQAKHLVESLPESWNTVTQYMWTTLYGDDDEALVYENVVDCLKNVASRKDRDSRNMEEDRYLSSEEEDHYSRDGSIGGFNGNCYNCGEFGHRKFECPY